jgi:hypothetical protein
MNILLPVLAVALAAASAFLAPREPVPDRGGWLRVVAALGLGLFAIVAAMRMAKGGGGLAVPSGLLIGILATGVAGWLGRPTTGLALGVAAAACLPILVSGADLPVAQFGLVAAAAIGALAFPGKAGIAAASTSAAVAAASYLADQRLAHAAAPTVALVIALGAVVGGVVGQAVKSPAIRAFLPPVGALVAAGVVGLRVVSEFGIPVTVAAGAVAGLAVRALVTDDAEADGLQVGLAALIWLGVATLAFGLLRGLGMSLALLGALAALLPDGGRRALLTVGPLAGLVMYRLLREAQPEASRALDIGQHYALVGLAVGLIVPLLPVEWRHPRGTERGEAAGAFLWGLLALGLPALVLLVFGGVGAVGFIAGLGFAALVQALRGRNESLPLPLGMGMAGTTVLLTGWLGTLTGLTRDEKLRALAVAGVAIVVIAGLLTLLARGVRTEEAR